MTREEKIDALIEDWLDSIALDGAREIEYILRNGFKGYEKMTDVEVDKEYSDAFGGMEDE